MQNLPPILSIGKTLVEKRESFTLLFLPYREISKVETSLRTWLLSELLTVKFSLKTFTSMKRQV